MLVKRCEPYTAREGYSKGLVLLLRKTAGGGVIGRIVRVKWIGKRCVGGGEGKVRLGF